RRTRADVAARGDPFGARRSAIRARGIGPRRPLRVLSECAVRARHLAARRGRVRAAGAARRDAAPQRRRRARRVPGDWRLQRRLAHETWDEVRRRGRRRATLDDLHQALKRLLTEQQMMFEAVWQRLTLAQRAVLRAVVLEDDGGLLSADVRTRHRLGGPSTVQA